MADGPLTAQTCRREEVAGIGEPVFTETACGEGDHDAIFPSLLARSLPPLVTCVPPCALRLRPRVVCFVFFPSPPPPSRVTAGTQPSPPRCCGSLVGG